jgi:V/A-type H+-transporting ATPase subunit I
MLVPMAKVEVIGPKNRFFEVVSLIHEQGKLHIEDLSKKIDAGDVPLDSMEVVSSQQTERDRMEELLLRVRAIIKALHLPGTTVDEAKRQTEYLALWKMDTRELGDEVAKVILEVEGRTSDLTSSQSKLEGEMELLARYEPILQKIQPLAKQIVTTGAFDSVALLFERRYKGALDELKSELDKITKKQCEIVSTDVDEETTAAIVVFNRAYAEPVHKFLAMENVNQIRLPSDFQDMPFDMAYDVIRDRRKQLPEKLKSVRSEVEEMSDAWYLKLATIRDVLADKVDEIKAIPKFGQTDFAFVISGWIPVNDVDELRKAIEAAFGNEIIVSQVAIHEEEFGDTPVAVTNPKAVQPFSVLLNIKGGMPKYGTVDPTWFIAVFYPLIFGMIVGDVGYGMIMLGVLVWLRLKFTENDTVSIVTSIFGPAATMTIFFGFLYGEFFGNLGKMWKIVPIEGYKVFGTSFLLPFNRIGLVTQFMLVALAVGVIQVVFGLILGVVNGVRTKHKKHVYEKGGMLMVLMSAILLGAAAIVNVSASFGPIIGGIIQIALAVTLVVGIGVASRGGAIGVIESIGQFSNVASYIRIMAVGLAGAIFADAINEMTLQMPLAMGLVLGILLHALNLLICAFSPNIHAIRLNLLEFFGKFYETAKQEYSPFHKTGGEKSA